jgi:hypothetical protein
MWARDDGGRGLLRSSVEPGLGDMLCFGAWEVGDGARREAETVSRRDVGGWMVWWRFRNGQGRGDRTWYGRRCAMAIIHFGGGLRDLPSWELSSLKRHCVLLVSQVSDHTETYRRT